MHFMFVAWLVAVAVFGALEGATATLTSIWFAVGALVAAIAAILGAGLQVQVILFLAVSIICVLSLRPLAKTKLGGKKKTATNADRIIGQEAVVKETVDNLAGTGAVSVSGSVWTARSENDTPIPVGCVVTVLRIEGVKVIVAPAQPPQ